MQTNPRKYYILQQELESIKDEMADAMQQANTAYVGVHAQMTLRMATVLGKFYDWARRAHEAGL